MPPADLNGFTQVILPKRNIFAELPRSSQGKTGLRGAPAAGKGSLRSRSLRPRVLLPRQTEPRLTVLRSPSPGEARTRSDRSRFRAS